MKGLYLSEILENWNSIENYKLYYKILERYFEIEENINKLNYISKKMVKTHNFWKLIEEDNEISNYLDVEKLVNNIKSIEFIFNKCKLNNFKDLKPIDPKEHNLIEYDDTEINETDGSCYDVKNILKNIIKEGLEETRRSKKSSSILKSDEDNLIYEGTNLINTLEEKMASKEEITEKTTTFAEKLKTFIPGIDVKKTVLFISSIITTGILTYSNLTNGNTTSSADTTQYLKDDMDISSISYYDGLYTNFVGENPLFTKYNVNADYSNTLYI